MQTVPKNLAHSKCIPLKIEYSKCKSATLLGNPLHGSSWEKRVQKQTHSLFGFGNCLKGMYQHPPRGGWHLLLSMWHFLDGPGVYRYIKIQLMEEILYQLIGSLPHYLQDFIHLRWCRILPHQQEPRIMIIKTMIMIHSGRLT